MEMKKKNKPSLSERFRDKNWLIGKALLMFGMVLAIIGLVKISNDDPIGYSYIFVGWVIAMIGAYFQDKSKRSKNPFEFNSFNQVVKIAVIMGLSIAIITGSVNNQNLAETLSFGVFAIIFLFILFFLYYKFKTKKMKGK